jgi:hypothetical protein
MTGHLTEKTASDGISDLHSQLELLAARQGQIPTQLPGPSPDVPNESPARQAQETRQTFSRTESGPGRAQSNRIIDNHHEYSRETYLALFRVVDLLEQDERARRLSVPARPGTRRQQILVRDSETVCTEGKNCPLGVQWTVSIPPSMPNGNSTPRSFTPRLNAVLRTLRAGKLADVAVLMHPGQQLI